MLNLPHCGKWAPVLALLMSGALPGRADDTVLHRADPVPALRPQVRDFERCGPERERFREADDGPARSPVGENTPGNSIVARDRGARTSIAAVPIDSVAASTAPLMLGRDPAIPFSFTNAGFLILGLGGVTGGLAFALGRIQRRVPLAMTESASEDPHPAEQVVFPQSVFEPTQLQRLISGDFATVDEDVQFNASIRLFGRAAATSPVQSGSHVPTIAPMAQEIPALIDTGESYHLSEAERSVAPPHFHELRLKPILREARAGLAAGELP